MTKGYPGIGPHGNPRCWMGASVAQGVSAVFGGAGDPGILVRPRGTGRLAKAVRQGLSESVSHAAVNLQTRPGGCTIGLWHLRDRRAPADRRKALIRFAAAREPVQA